MKTLFVGLSLSVISVFTVSADTFSTTVDVTRQHSPVTVRQVQAMILPHVKIEKQVKNGRFLCSTNGQKPGIEKKYSVAPHETPSLSSPVDLEQHSNH